MHLNACLGEFMNKSWLTYYVTKYLPEAGPREGTDSSVKLLKKEI